jgi:hypothetical protein
MKSRLRFGCEGCRHSAILVVEMTVQSEQDQLRGIIDRICDALYTIIPLRGETGSSLRRKIGFLRTEAFNLLLNKQFAAYLLDILTVARSVPVDITSITRVRNVLLAETPTGEVSTRVVQTAIVYCLAYECRIISTTEYTSQSDVQVVIDRMNLAFASAREMAADSMDSASYQEMTALNGSIMNHLASVSRQLPRVVRFEFNDYYPTLYLANRIYQDASRSEEISAENKTIHPLFVQRSIIGLSA